MRRSPRPPRPPRWYGSRSRSVSSLTENQLEIVGGDDGIRTRVHGFADRSLATRARRHFAGAWLPREDSNLGSRIQSPLSCQLDDGASAPPHEASRSSNRGSPRAGQKNGAEDGTRTRDPHLGKVMLYQLSHFRPLPIRAASDGAEGQNRTDDTRLFRAVLYQLSYLGPPVDPWRCSPRSWSRIDVRR